MTTSAALAAVVTVVSGVSGIRRAPSNPTETANAFPFAICYIQDGQADASPMGTRKHLFSIAVEVYTARKDLARDFAVIAPFVDTVPAALLAEVSAGGDQFSGTLATFEGVSYELIERNYAGVDVIGYKFVMNNVKIII